MIPRACVQLGLVAGLVTSLQSGLRAQEVSGPPQPCTGERYHDFDFWVGDWEVFAPGGQRVGTNRIEKIQSGCVLQEHWVGAQGDTGTSFNIYDHTTGQWHQSWVSNAGMLLLLDGEFANGVMRLSGTTVGRGGETVRHRVSWEPLAPDSVRQLWETSRDDATWNVVFDGRYVPQRAAAPPGSRGP